MLCIALLLLTTASAISLQSSARAQSAGANLTPSELDNLVSPIALYPNSPVAQILAGSTYPPTDFVMHGWIHDF